MRECKLCRKIFSGAGGRICGECAKELDILYKEVRSYIRDHDDEKLGVEEISEGLGVDIRKVQMLVDERYLARDLPDAQPSEDNRRERLAKQFEESVKILQANAQKRGTVTYGQQRHGIEKKDKD
jgi:hypothetical protein